MFQKIKIEFGFGAGFDSYQKPLSESDARDGMTVIRREAVLRFGGYTLTPTQGGWINPDGVLVEEPGYTLMVLVDEYDSVKAEPFAAFIRGALRQEAVVIVVTVVHFVTQYVYS